MRRAIFCFLATVVLLTSLPGSPAPGREAASFEQLLAEAGLTLSQSDALEETAVTPNPLFAFEKAFRHKRAALDVWYAVRPLARLEIKYEDPHSSAPNPDHIFPMVFQTLIGRLARHGHTPNRVYPTEKARKLFNADWAAATLFDTDPELGSKYAQGLLIAMHKTGKGDAYALFLFDDAKATKPAIDALLGQLRFKSAPVQN